MGGDRLKGESNAVSLTPFLSSKTLISKCLKPALLLSVQFHCIPDEEWRMKKNEKNDDYEITLTSDN